MRVAVTGSHGLIGSALVPALEAAGHEVVRLVRGRPSTGEVGWNPQAGELDAAALAGVDGAVHLAGAGIGDKRWTGSVKHQILESRVKGTELLARALASVRPRPAVLVSGSAVGFYGDRGDEELTEASERGTGFLAEVTDRWERSTAAAEDAGIRVVRIRTGIVLSGGGGALAKMLPLFKRGLGGKLGPGTQWVSWIALHDEVAAIRHALHHDELHGPMNLVAPHPVTNAEMTDALARVIGKPARIAVPKLAMQIALGPEMAGETVLVSQKVRPVRLQASGFAYAHPLIDEALAAALGKECC